ncbi:hypothetical protein Desor_3973 [Desulfosporosinus orientis DSM 765]|uniref:Lipoprotein n=1 Tax=Desulfosporosinus orientis (strain ATCC 19365 / DSM 765 / NCIMB 8382 / VKM B-1628 / Singapore I) TaxID=768706 RepID=G7WE19_DESOD|nr:hypothetical protein [Desulfosporosinus orientis]AET69417.1 hypothetical protein Desor_3973 [Desulfosporosinus orientis DSM 765]
MIRVGKILLVGLFLILLSGCAGPSWTTAGKIIPPVHNTCPLEGQWQVSQNLQTIGMYEGDNPSWDGQIIQFTTEVAVVGDHVWRNPVFKIKKVDTASYLMSKYVNLPSQLMPDGKEVEVLTVSSAENFLGEFMKIDEHRLLAFVQNNVLYLEKVSDQVDSSLAGAKLNDVPASQQSYPGSSGVLLGLKIAKDSHANSNEKAELGDFDYQTLWLAVDDQELHPILKDKNIFFPRRSGFWELQTGSGQEGQKEGDGLSAHDVSTKVQDTQLKTMTLSRGDVKIEAGKKVIDYVGNDYVAVENDLNGLRLQVLPVDKISASEGIKASDLLGEIGLAAFSNARDQAGRALSHNTNVTSIDDQDIQENFGLIRKNGHWYLRGRINYRYQDADDFSHMDFNVNLVPPAKLIAYDTLCLSWQYIKDRVPDAVDAFTSPNRNMALVITKTKLLVYAINGGQLVSEALAKIDLEPGTSVIMAEWATGSYVDNWEKAFLANGAEVSNNIVP